MDFLDMNDFNGVLSSGVKTEFEQNFDEAEALAISYLDPLKGKYNIDAELQKDGDKRNKTLVRILVNITAYYVYNQVPDDDIPDRIRDNWKQELATIDKIASGKMNSTLESLTTETGDSVTGVRWNSNPRRSHSLYPRSTTAEDTV